MLDEATQAELDDLIAAMRDREFSDEQAGRLAEILRGSAEARAAYLRRVDQAASIRRYSADLSFTHDPAEAEPTSMLTEALMRQRLGAGDEPGGGAVVEVDDDDLSTVREAIVAEPGERRASGWAAQRLIIVAAAVLLLGVIWSTTQLLTGSLNGLDAARPAAALTPGDDAVWEAGDGSDLSDLRLASGTVALAFDSGARVTVTGPAEFAVVNAMRMDMRHGRLLASVPPEAVGFAVTAPGFEVIDRGTEFAVDVPRTGRAWVHVVRGAVDLTLTNADGSTGRPMQLTEDQSAKIDPVQRRVVRSEPVKLELHNTGVGLELGQADPHWRITFVIGDGEHTPGEAFAAKPDPHWADPPANERSQWISRFPDNRRVAGTTVHTFATAFDLTGLDPSTARLTLRFIADNRVDAIRINGLSVDVPEHRDEPPFDTFTELTIDTGFVPGLNELELDVRNLWPNDAPSPMGLRVELEGTAHRTVEWGTPQESTP